MKTSESRELVLCDEHSQVYEYWCARRAVGIEVAHVDFHCDMRGFFVDRRRQRAYVMGGNGSLPAVDSGNYLGVAIMEGRVRSVRWIHDAHGGRRYDAGTVKYESDLTALPLRWRRWRSGDTGREVDFEEMDLDDWEGVRDGGHLDIDWDGLASIEYERGHIVELTRAFLARDWSVVPTTTFLVLSPGYSHPDRSLYEEFARGLASRFDAEIVRLPAPALRPGFPAPPQRLTGGGRLKHRLVLRLHRLGIY